VDDQYPGLSRARFFYLSLKFRLMTAERYRGMPGAKSFCSKAGSEFVLEFLPGSEQICPSESAIVNPPPGRGRIAGLQPE